jgi:folate-dependent phosphoribosylglycinamide formyltransferase PurN
VKLVAISCLGVDHEYVLRALHRQFPLQAIIRPIAPRRRSRRTLAEKLGKFASNPLQTVSERLNDCYFQFTGRRFQRQLAAELREDNASTWDVPIHRVPRNELHSPEIQQLLTDLSPDLMITSGCPLLRPELFNLPHLGTINIHWGVAPQYRGEHTLFWPLYFNDPDNLGVTIHQIDNSIDGGPMLAQRSPDLSPQETELSATVKVARLTAELLPQVVTEIRRTGRITGTAPRGTGKLFVRRGRRWHHDLRYWCRRHWTSPTPIPCLDK